MPLNFDLTMSSYAYYPRNRRRKQRNWQPAAVATDAWIHPIVDKNLTWQSLLFTILVEYVVIQLCLYKTCTYCTYMLEELSEKDIMYTKKSKRLGKESDEIVFKMIDIYMYTWL
jgi:hypothetical protein